MKLADQLRSIMNSFFLVSFELVLQFGHFSDEFGNVLDEFIKIHRGSPVFFIFWNDMQKQISSVCKRRIAKLYTQFNINKWKEGKGWERIP